MGERENMINNRMVMVMVITLQTQGKDADEVTPLPALKAVTGMSQRTLASKYGFWEHAWWLCPGTFHSGFRVTSFFVEGKGDGLRLDLRRLSQDWTLAPLWLRLASDMSLGIILRSFFLSFVLFCLLVCCFIYTSLWEKQKQAKQGTHP